MSKQIDNRITQKVQYFTKDGSVFETKEEAVDHLRQQLITQLMPDMIAPYKNMLMDKFDELIESFYEAGVLGHGTVTHATFGRRDDF